MVTNATLKQYLTMDFYLFKYQVNEKGTVNMVTTKTQNKRDITTGKSTPQT